VFICVHPWLNLFCEVVAQSDSSAAPECRATSGVQRLVSALRGLPAKRVEMSLDPCRHECLRHIAAADNVKLLLRGS
jgi:hypothetical protein